MGSIRARVVIRRNGELPGNLLPPAVHFLVDNRPLESKSSVFTVDQKITTAICSNTARPRKIQGDLAGVCARRDDEVVFELFAVTVINNVDSLVHVLISRFAVGR